MADGRVRSCRGEKDRGRFLHLCNNVQDEAGRPGRLLQGGGVRMVLGWSGAEWRESPMQDRTMGGGACGG